MTLGLFNSLAHKIGMRKNGYKYSLNHYGAEIKRKKKDLLENLSSSLSGIKDLSRWVVTKKLERKGSVGIR